MCALAVCLSEVLPVNACLFVRALNFEFNAHLHAYTHLSTRSHYAHTLRFTGAGRYAHTEARERTCMCTCDLPLPSGIPASLLPLVSCRCMRAFNRHHHVRHSVSICPSLSPCPQPPILLSRSDHKSVYSIVKACEALENKAV